jgi:hypothetical protein
MYYGTLPDDKLTKMICTSLWHYYFKWPLDTLPYDGKIARDTIRKYFFNESKWDEKYSFIEFCATFDDPGSQFKKCINQVLVEELAGYRLIDTYITEITDEKELLEIESALIIDDEVTVHLKTALNHLSNKKQPDYRNSIKESISGVEAICKKIADNPKGTLTDTLNAIERKGKIKFHGAEKSAFNKLYGWTSDADGIRHSLMDSTNLDQEDARFMLISCSAFINYLKIKADKAGIKF